MRNMVCEFTQCTNTRMSIIKKAQLHSLFRVERPLNYVAIEILRYLPKR